jgi:hypothetical protein
MYLKFINIVFQIFSLLVPPTLTSIGFAVTAVWLLSFELIVLKALHQTKHFAAYICNNLLSLWLKCRYSNGFPISNITTSSKLFKDIKDDTLDIEKTIQQLIFLQHRNAVRSSQLILCLPSVSIFFIL